jgi:hypothetical protein
MDTQREFEASWGLDSDRASNQMGLFLSARLLPSCLFILLLLGRGNEHYSPETEIANGISYLRLAELVV